MLGPLFLLEEHDPKSLTFSELVKFIELCKPKNQTLRVVKFSSYLDASLDHKGIAKIIPNWGGKSYLGSVYRYTVYSNILNLLGPTGVLPCHYTQRAMAFLRDGDSTMVDLLNIFYNKILYSLYRITKRKDVLLHFQLYSLEKEESPPYSIRQISALTGVEFGQDFCSVMLRYSGLVAMHSRPACILQTILESFARVRVELRQFLHIRKPLPEKEYVKLGGKNCSFRKSFYCGNNVYLYQNKIHIYLKHLNAEAYKNLIVQKRDKKSLLNKLISIYLGSSITYSIELRILESYKLVRFGNLSLGIDLWCSSKNAKFAYR